MSQIFLLFSRLRRETGMRGKGGKREKRKEKEKEKR